MNPTMILSDRSTGEVTFEGVRVGGRGPRCPICENIHQAQSWCLVDVQRRLAICPRVESKRRIGSAGWLHAFDGSALPRDSNFRRPIDSPPPLARAEAMHTDFVRAGVDRLPLLAFPLGLTQYALRGMGTGWSEQETAWTFPMRNHRDEIIGFRTRMECGRKLSIRGSRSGIFIPRNRERGNKHIYIVEGPTDCAAMIDLQCNAIGRAACRGQEQEIAKWVKGMAVTIVADSDFVGRAGAEELARVIAPCTTFLRVIVPPSPHKDVRAFLLHGGTKASLETWESIGASPKTSHGRQTCDSQD